MLPDIQVIKHSKIVCVVEIGYTRPEKITEYRRMGIPDIRWYSKEGELHNEQNLVSRVEKLVPPDTDVWRGVWLGNELILEVCEICYGECEKAVRDEAKNGNIDLTSEECSISAIEMLDEDVGDEKAGWLFTNGLRRCLVVECDICGFTRLVTGEFEDEGITLLREHKQELASLDTYDDFVCYWNRLTRYNDHPEVTFMGAFDEVQKAVKGYCGEELEYGECRKWQGEGGVQ
jgi:hypothetical protein